MAQYGSSSGPIGPPINPYEIDRRLGMPVDSMVQNMRNARQQEAAPLYAKALEDAILAQRQVIPDTPGYQTVRLDEMKTEPITQAEVNAIKARAAATGQSSIGGQLEDAILAQQSQAKIPADVQAQKLADVYRRNAQVPRTYGSQQGPTSMLSDKGLQFKPIDHTAFLGSVAADNKNLAGSLGKGVDAAGNAGRNLAHLLGVGVEQQGNQMRLESDKMRFAPKTPEELRRELVKDLVIGRDIDPATANKMADKMLPAGGTAGPPLPPQKYLEDLVEKDNASKVTAPTSASGLEVELERIFRGRSPTPQEYASIQEEVRRKVDAGELAVAPGGLGSSMDANPLLKLLLSGAPPEVVRVEAMNKRVNSWHVPNFSSHPQPR